MTRPNLSKTAVEKSMESRTIGEYAVRMTANAISSAIEPRAFLTISNVIASVATVDWLPFFMPATPKRK
ncbi:hypothetical protein D3C71_1688090 [compost metagenome]